MPAVRLRIDPRSRRATLAGFNFARLQEALDLAQNAAVAKHDWKMAQFIGLLRYAVLEGVMVLNDKLMKEKSRGT